MAITRYRGRNRRIRRKLVDSETGLALNIASHSFTLVVDERSNPTDITTRVFSVAGTVEGDGSSGVFHFTLGDSEANIAAGTYYYEIVWTDINNEDETLEKSVWIVCETIGDL